MISVSTTSTNRAWCDGGTCSRVDIGLHQFTQSRVNQFVPTHWREPGKGFGFYADMKMAAAITCSGVTGMQMALIFNIQRTGRKRLLQRAANHLDAITHGDWQ